jgi:hypothetical protein
MTHDFPLTYEELKGRLAEAEAQADHIKNVLTAIRRINRLIVSENDSRRLIQRACLELTETMAYHNAWILLVDDGDGAVSAWIIRSRNPFSSKAFFPQKSRCQGASSSG